LHQHHAGVSAKSPLGEAFKYIAKYWDGLNLFLTDGRIELDNNPVDAPSAPLPSTERTHSSPGMMPGPKTGASSRH